MANKQIFIYPVPWDITTTFHHGTAQGPEQIQAVFHQLDETHPL
jgi:arginase family enzyme